MADQAKTPSALDDLSLAASNTMQFLKSQAPGAKAAVATAVAPLTKAYQNTLDYYGGVAKKVLASGKESAAKIASGTAATTLKPAAQQARAVGKELYEQATKKPEPTVITDKQRSEAENRVLKNPLEANGFEARSQAIGGKRERMLTDERYRALPAQQKLQQDIMFYKRYVVPTFTEAGKTPIPLKEWLRHAKPVSKEMGVAQDIIGGATKGALGISIAGAQFNRKEWSVLYGLNHFYKNLAHGEFDASVAWGQGKADAERSLVQRAIGSMQGGLDEVNFFINSRPRDNMLSSLSVGGGEMIAQLPVYEAIGAAGAAGLKVGEGANLTKTLMATKTGQWVAKRMVNAADGYLTGRATGMSDEESKKQAAIFTAFGAAGSVVKPGWQKLVKRFSAEVVAAGGEPMAADLTESAMAELREEGKVATPQEESVPSEPPGVSGARPADDHVNNKMHEAEKDIIQRIIDKVAPGKKAKDLSEAEIDKVMAERSKLNHAAAAEAPAHLPDLVQAQEEHSIEEWNKNNPDSAAITKMLEEAGIPVGRANAENIINTVEHQTGLTNPERAASAVADAPLEHSTAELVADRSPEEKANAEPSGTIPEKDAKTVEYEPKEGASAAVNMDEFMWVHNDVKAFYKNPGKRLAKDGSMVGARDKRPWNVRMKDENTKKFDEMLRDIDGNKIPFEKWEDRALWHLNFEKDMDASMRRKLRYQLENANRLQVGGKKPTRAQLNTRARRTADHLKMLIETGRIRKGETFFASTKSAGRRTPWQIELRTERDRKSVRAIRNNVKRTKGGTQMVDAITNIVK